MGQRRRSSSNVHQATLVKYYEMCQALSSKNFIRSGLESNQFVNQRVAAESFDAMVQWLAFHATKGVDSPPSVMLVGGADKMLSLFTSNPTFYNEFCLKYVGYVITRIPAEASWTPVIRDGGGIEQTVEGLNSAFGSELCSTLRNWETMRAINGTVKFISIVGEPRPEYEIDIESQLEQLWLRI